MTYGNTKEKPLYRPGQGSTYGPLFWLLCYWVTQLHRLILDPSITNARFLSAYKEVIMEITGASFVDDTLLCVTSDNQPNHNVSPDENKSIEIEQLIKDLEKLSQHWE